MRRLWMVLGLVAALYGAYWYAGSVAVERVAGAAIERLAVGGWRLEYQSTETSGSAARFGTRINRPRVIAPDGSVVWEAPFLQVLALSVRPNHAVLVLPPEQRLFLPGGPRPAAAGDGTGLTVLSDDLRASAAVRTRSDLALAEASLEGTGLNLHDRPSGYALAVRRLAAGLRDSGPQDATYDLTLEVDDLVAGLMVDVADVSAQATAELDRPLDRHLGGPPRLRSLGIGRAELTVGGAEAAAEDGTRGELHASGTLVVAPDGTLAGELHLSVTNWDAIIAAAREAGLVDEGLGVLYQRFLDEAAAGADTAEVPLVLEGGRVSALGLPLGIVPPLLPPQRQ